MYSTIKIYWDTTSEPEGWAFAAYHRNADGEEDLRESGCLDADDDDLDGAIEGACYQLGVDLRPDQFAREPHQDGGWAEWTAMED